MPFDEHLADRIRAVLRDRTDVTERKMFGGLAFLIRDHMTVGIVGRDLMVRVGAAQFETALAQPHARPMDFTGRPSKGMVYVSPAGLRTERSLSRWIDRARQFVDTLSDKSVKNARGRAASARK
jgi:TfoX/Sxy family transcriptional regulator of competence genes